MALLSPIRFIEAFLNTNQNAARPRLQSKKMRKGIVIEVNEHFGRVLCARSFSDPNVYVFFTRETRINGASMNTFFQSLTTVPVGAEVEFRLTYDFPSTWRSFGTCMGYFCEAMNYFVNNRIPKRQEKLVVREHRQNGIIVATDCAKVNFIIHPQVWPSVSSVRKLYSGLEIEPKINHRFQIVTQLSRTLLADVLPMPPFLKPKLRHIDYLVISIQPLSTTSIIYGELQGGGPEEVYFDSIGVRTDTGDNDSILIVMDTKLFAASVGWKNPNISKFDIWKLIGEVYQLGCVLDVQSKKVVRAFCAYDVKDKDMPRKPIVQLPKEIRANSQDKTSIKVKPRPLLPQISQALQRMMAEAVPPQTLQPQQGMVDESVPHQTTQPRQQMMHEEEVPMNISSRKDATKLNTSLPRRSINRKYDVRKNFRKNSRKREFNPCSPCTDLAVKTMLFGEADRKKKNLTESFQDFTLSDSGF